MWDRIWVSVCYVLIALVLVYEIWALLDRSPATPPITNIFVKEVPWWITLPFLLWLFLHFLNAYAQDQRWNFPRLPL